ncbi:MAG: penicillin-binding protein 2 [bacterium]|nr:penicillin-binding protein 2 [bacterium]
MFIEKRRVSKQEIKRISLTINIITVVLFIILLFSFWSIQVIRNYYYTTLAARNMMKEIEITAPRGLILDRNLERLSENKISFNLFLTLEYARNINRTVKAAAAITGMTEEEIRKKLEKYKGYPRSYAIPLKKNLPRDKAIYIESRSDEMPEFEINIEPARAYPYKKIASHVLGYISELTSSQLKQRTKQGYRLGDVIGTSGMEKIYETNLKGVRGSKTVEKDNLGKIRQIISEEDPLIGNTIVLTIDIKLQEFIEELDSFKTHNGAVGVVDLRTGGLLALVSKPNFNPGFFSGSLDRKQWQALQRNPDKPLHNKFIQGLYLPGSTFKIVMALAGLQEKTIDTGTSSFCRGNLRIYDRVFHCWRRSGHGSMNVYDALKNSCNIYFYRLGKKLDIDVIAGYAKQLGLGGATLIDLPNEKKGLIPTKAWKRRQLNQKWFPGETISVVIGGGMMNVTPAQILTMISTVALRGRKPRLHLLKHIEKNGRIVEEFIPRFDTVDIAKENFEIVIEGLHKVVNDGGTGRATKIDGLDVCGKTGTQLILSLQNPNYRQLVKKKKFKPHAWFASFAPRNNPEIAMVVFVENGGDAGAIAAPIAKKIYTKIFENRKKSLPEPPPEKTAVSNSVENQNRDQRERTR